MNEETVPKFFSLELHTRFFPALLLSHLRPRERTGTSFVSTEGYILFVFCLVLAAVGFPNALAKGSFIGWAMGGIGSAGALALILSSIFTKGDPPSYQGFLLGIFFFFLSLGITAGIFTGTLEHSFLLGLFAVLAGLITGYLMGILAGLAFQYLGWMASIFNALAGIMVIGMIVLDLVLLFG